jgi:hypothetical protein
MCISHKNDTAYPERDAKGVRVDKSSKKKYHMATQASTSSESSGSRHWYQKHQVATLPEYIMGLQLYMVLGQNIVTPLHCFLCATMLSVCKRITTY